MGFSQTVPPKHLSQMDDPPDRNGQREAAHVAISGSGGPRYLRGKERALAVPARRLAVPLVAQPPARRAVMRFYLLPAKVMIAILSN